MSDRTFLALLAAPLILIAPSCADTASSPGAADSTPDAAGDRDAGAGLDARDPEPSPEGSPEPEPLAEDAGQEADQGTPEDVRLSDADEACVAFNVLAESALKPVDILWIIDASPSMGEEIALIEQNIDRFAERIGASTLDYRVVIIGSDQAYCGEAQCFLPICAPPPLSAEAVCPDLDSERYLHVRQGVHSRDGLDVAIATANQWLGFLRTGAQAHFIMVTDDNSGFGADADDFAAFMARQGEPLASARFHSIVDLVGYQPGCGVFDDEECSCGEERGQTYIDLSERTGGLVESVCQENWDAIFLALEERVREGTELPCTFRIPNPGGGRQVNPEEVNVVFFSSDRSERTLIPQIDSAEDCPRTAGWYYDNPVRPTLIHLCPEICAMEADIVEVELGCRTVKN